MPGVIVKTATRTGPATADSAASGRYFVSGLTERGPIDSPVMVRSMAEYEVMLGARTSYGALYDNLKSFFEEGGSEAWVARIVGTAATSGTVTLKDRAGTPMSTLDVRAANPGAWSQQLTVEVAAGSAAGTYALRIALNGDRMETFDNLVTPADAVTAAAKSSWVRIIDKASASIAPMNQPKVAAPAALSAGVDDRASVTAFKVAGGLNLFRPELGVGAVACPGYDADMVGSLLMAHAQDNRRTALLASFSDATVDDVLSSAVDLTTPDGEWGGIFYPWVNVPDGGNGSRAISPEGYVAAVRARAHNEIGSWGVPAGDIAKARYVLSPVVDLTRAEGDRLDEGRVSAIRVKGGAAELYGWRSLSTDSVNYALLSVRDLLNYLSYEAEELLEPFVFKTIDGRGQVLGRVYSTLVGLCDPVREAGGLYEKLNPATGDQIDPGYSVDVGPAVNTDSVLSRNELRAVMAVRPSPVSSDIELTIVKAGLTAAV